MSDYYLCSLCRCCNLQELYDFYHLECSKGETELKVMHDYGPAATNHEHIDGYRDPNDVCGAFEPREGTE